MRFNFIAYSRQGKRISGTLRAASSDAAEETLWARDLVVVGLRQMGSLLFVRKQLPSLFGVKRKDIVIFTQQFAILLRSGVPAYRAISILADQQNSKTFRSVLREILEALQEGQSLSMTLEDYPDIFPHVYRKLVRVGESTGRLTEVLERVAAHMVREDATASRVRGAMIYPAIILCLAIGVIVVLMTVTLPSIVNLLNEFHSDLPWTTRLLMNTSNWMVANQVSLVLAVVLIALSGQLLSSVPSGRAWLNLAKLKAPLLGPLNRTSALTSITSTTSILLRAGLPLLEVMQMLEETSENVVIRGALAGIREGVVQGLPFSEAMSKNWIFPSMLIQMVRVGEETGTMESSLESVSDFYEQETDRTISALTSLLGPFVIIVVGGFIGFVFASVLSAMYSAYGAIK